jgi:hypothetical protein
MADDPLKIRLDPKTDRKLRAAAKAAGLSPERMAEMALEAFAAEDAEGGVREPKRAWQDIADPDITFPATTPADYGGPYVELEEALDAFDAELDRRLASRDV